MSELEYDIPAAATAWNVGKAAVEHEADGALMLSDGEACDEEGCGCDDEEEQDCGCDEEDPLAGATADAGTADSDSPAKASDAADAAGTTSDAEEDPTSDAEAEEKPAKKQKRSKSQGMSDRLKDLAKPRQAKETPKEPDHVIKKKEKKPQASRPSLLLRLRPTNLEEAYEKFFEGGFKEAPQFTYAFPEEQVTKAFQDNSDVCFELMPEAKRILEKVHDLYGGPDAFMQVLYGEEKVPAEEMASTVAAYLKEHNIEDKVEIRIVDSMLSAANVVKPSADEKYVVNIAKGPVSKNMVQGICDHEVGTHLLRMMNDEHQVWHGKRDRYKLMNPWTTEEGFATVNTYMSMPTKLLYPQALRYFAVCRGAQLGFVELFAELLTHVNDPKKCWQMCCRIKRGMTDTSQPGAFYMDQAYFKGAVEILRHLDEVDFGRLYGGQIALQDLDKVHFLFRKECVRLPCFLNTAEKLKTYLAHCRKLIKENGIETAIERVCKPVFIRTAKEFFKTKPKAELRATSATLVLGGTMPEDKLRNSSEGPSRAFDASRLEELARPRPLMQHEQDGYESGTSHKKHNHARMVELAMPRARAELEESTGGDGGSAKPPGSRTLNERWLQDLARPRQASAEASQDPCRPRARNLTLTLPRGSAEEGDEAPDSARPGSAPSARRPGRDRSRPPLPKGSADDSEASYPPPPPPPPRPVDQARLSLLAMPRKTCDEEAASGKPCACLPKARRRKKKRRSKHRILAMVQAKLDADAGGEGGNSFDVAGDDSGSEDEEATKDLSDEVPGDAITASDPALKEAGEEAAEVQAAASGAEVSTQTPRRRGARRSRVGWDDSLVLSEQPSDAAGPPVAAEQDAPALEVTLKPGAQPATAPLQSQPSRPSRAAVRARSRGFADAANSLVAEALAADTAAATAPAAVLAAAAVAPGVGSGTPPLAATGGYGHASGRGRGPGLPRPPGSELSQTAPQASGAPLAGGGGAEKDPAALLMAALERQSAVGGSLGAAQGRLRRPRPSASCPSRTVAPANADGSLWKAVPIKTMQLDLGL